MTGASPKDQEGELEEADFIENLSLQKLVNENKCLCQIPCSAVLGYGKKVHKSIKKWLNLSLNNNGKDYEAITEHVQKDTREQCTQEELDRKECEDKLELAIEQEERGWLAALEQSSLMSRFSVRERNPVIGGEEIVRPIQQAGCASACAPEVEASSGRRRQNKWA
ncbi:hypothetical protein Q8A73_004950 [Channa argus]|nr:hypothetical protein Q8A73_004950 [Channa argus]